MIVYECPACGEQEKTEIGPPRWTRYADRVEHYHSDDQPHWPGVRVEAVPVEVYTEQEIRERLNGDEARAAALTAFNESPSTGFRLSFDHALEAAVATLSEEGEDQ